MTTPEKRLWVALWLCGAVLAAGCQVNRYCESTQDCDRGDVCESDAGMCRRSGSVQGASSQGAATSTGGTTSTSVAASSRVTSSSAGVTSGPGPGSSLETPSSSTVLPSSSRVSLSSSSRGSSSGGGCTCVPAPECGGQVTAAACVDRGCQWSGVPECSGVSTASCGAFNTRADCVAALGCTPMESCQGTSSTVTCSVDTCAPGCGRSCEVPPAACSVGSCPIDLCQLTMVCTGTGSSLSVCAALENEANCTGSVGNACSWGPVCKPQQGVCPVISTMACPPGCATRMCVGTPLPCAAWPLAECTGACTAPFSCSGGALTCSGITLETACTRAECQWMPSPTHGTCAAAALCALAPTAAGKCEPGCTCVAP